MARRTRSLLTVAAVAACIVGLSQCFVAAPGAASRPEVAQVATPAVAAANAVMLASMPMPAHAGGMFDFGLTLPFVAIFFLSMMVILNALWYAPVAEEVEERNAKLLQTLSEATDMLSKADEIQVEYTEKIRETREKAAKAVAEFRSETEEKVNFKISEAKAARNAKIEAAKAAVEKELREKKEAAGPEIEKRQEAFVKELLAEVA
eukprot:CAMPEP_0178401662 /NCGR_PEP_ID=MMETSP0689_2-20121128/16420_1 /TAXON_ID=160604 /ORGANISM="Amphidinium massartii, Strain CS-259" /LENGTH=205 /DNA_ID=CAMNT_0020022495 /DNA_START=62 /DNA_END=679 /DNA_ORIENTATION=+